MTVPVGIAALEAGLADLEASPRDEGVVELIVARPAVGERAVLAAGTFTIEDGLEGDGWRRRGSGSTPDGRADRDRQVTLINRRLLELVAPDRARWPLAGDQLVVDLHLGDENLRPGDRLAAGTAVFEVTPAPHTGCVKFRDRFGRDALRFVSSPDGRRLRLRGLYVKVVQPGTVSTGQAIVRAPAEAWAPARA